jgi:hypothetical protein
MIIVSVEFTRSPPAKSLYEEAIKINPKWKTEIDDIVKRIIRSPTIGSREDLLSKNDRNFSKKKNFHELNELDNAYKKVGAIGVALSDPTSSYSIPTEYRNRNRFVYSVYAITDLNQFTLHYDRNTSSLFKISLDESDIPCDNVPSNKYGVLYIIEVGRHYKFMDKKVDPSTASNTESISKEDELFLDEVISSF